MEWEIRRFCHQIRKVWHKPGSSRLSWPACRTAQLSVKNQVASPARGVSYLTPIITMVPDSQVDKGGQQFPLFLLLLFLRRVICIFFLKIFQLQSLHDDLSKCVISTKLNLGYWSKLVIFFVHCLRTFPMNLPFITRTPHVQPPIQVPPSLASSFQDSN